MKKIFLIAILKILSINCIAQNLVPNPGFENYSNCPNGSSQFSVVSNWTGPNNSTDYFNVCSTNLSSTLPQISPNQIINAHTGNACAAIWLFNSPGNNYREYLQVSLNNTLNAGYYYTKFFCFIPTVCKYSVNNLYSNFSPISVTNTSTGLVLSLTKHIYNFDNRQLSDTTNWMYVQGIYYAQGNENFITIGNFNNDNNTDTANNLSGTYPGTYMYIDDVSVTNITTPQWQYRDTTITIGDSVLIGPAITGLNIDWYTMANSWLSSITWGKIHLSKQFF